LAQHQFVVNNTTKVFQMKEPKAPTPKLPDQKVQNVVPQKPLGPSTSGSPGGKMPNPKAK